MKRTLVALASVALCFTQVAIASNEKVAPLQDKKDKISYSIGVDVGKSIQKQKIDINTDAFIRGFKEGHSDKLSSMTEDEVRETLLGLQNEMLEKQKEELKVLAAKNLAEGERFLAENKKRKDVIALESGLQYRVITPGKGDAPKATDTVTTHYVGKLINGQEFDSSRARGEPVKFVVNGVIPGWTEALELMKPGAKWELFIPPKLAYGEHGIGQVIGPNSTLIFEVELLNVEKPTAEPAAATTSAAKKVSTKQ